MMPSAAPSTDKQMRAMLAKEIAHSRYLALHRDRWPCRYVLMKVALVLLAGVLTALQIGAVGAQSPATRPGSSSGNRSMPAPQRMFISGHSLTNEPIPSDLAAIAGGFGIQFAWNRQHLEGSSIKQRSRGDATGNAPWTGYARGIDRANQPMDVLAEFRRQDKPYDTLLITEQHSLLGSLVWNETVPHLRNFHERFIAHNPNGTTYFFEPWLSLDDKSDPKRWIDYERAAAPVWRCIVEQMNQTLAAEGRRDHIVSLPAALALVHLIELATQGSGVAGITRDSARSTVDGLVADDVHLTRLGNYYVALVTFTLTFRHPVQGAWRPAEITSEQANSLQTVASAFAQLPQPAAMPIAVCRSHVLRSFMWTYLGYANRAHLRKEQGYLGSLYLRLKLVVQWWLLFSSDKPENPFGQAAYGKR
jgi:hypothetical protein